MPTFGDKRISFTENDSLVAPHWMPVSIKADDDLILFSFSDRAAQDNSVNFGLDNSRLKV